MDLNFDKCEIMSFSRNQGFQNDYIVTDLANDKAYLVSRSGIQKDLGIWIQVGSAVSKSNRILGQVLDCI